jgi:hypothetical protein
LDNFGALIRRRDGTRREIFVGHPNNPLIEKPVTDRLPPYGTLPATSISLHFQLSRNAL